MKELLFTDRNYNLWFLIIHVSNTLYKARSKELSPFGITSQQAAVLFAIKAIGAKATPAQVSRFLLLEPHSISEMLQRMEQGGLVRRANDLPRKNMVRVVITEKGQQVYNQSIKREVIHRINSCLSKDELQQLGIYLERLWDKALEEFPLARKPPFPPPTGNVV